MVDLGSLGELHRHAHELHAFCARCDHWRVLDLAALVEAGQADRRLPVRVRCRTCGEAGQLQVRPPMPGRSSTGWITPVSPVF